MSMTADTTKTYDYSVVKDVLTDIEKERIVCVYLNSLDPNNVAWEAASNQFGSASVASFRKGMQNTVKKLQTAIDAAEKGEPLTPAKSTPATKAAKTPKSSGKKRKTKSVISEGNDGGDEATELTPPTPKKRGRKSKKNVETEDAAEEEVAVKAELEEE